MKKLVGSLAGGLKERGQPASSAKSSASNEIEMGTAETPNREKGFTDKGEGTQMLKVEESSTLRGKYLQNREKKNQSAFSPLFSIKILSF